MPVKNITVAFPLEVREGIGIVPIDENSIVEAVKFQLKNIILTRPGEKLSDPNFGVGLHNFLFSQESTKISAIRNRINNQIRKYMNYFDTLDIDVKRTTNSDISISVYIRFVISQPKLEGELEVSV